MKKFLISAMVMAMFFMTSCGTNPQQNYVKNIYFSKADNSYEIIFQTYDFTSTEESYLKYRYKTEDIFKTSIKATQVNNFNYRLCENVLIDMGLFYSDFDKIFTDVNRLKIPPSANVLCVTGQIDDSFSGENLIDTPLYGFSYKTSGTDGIVQITDNSGENIGALIISQGDAVKVVSDKQWKLINMLQGNKGGFSYTFRNDEIYAVFDKSDVYYHTDNGLSVNITLSLKDYKGVNNSRSGIDTIKSIIEGEISDNINELYNDVTIKNVCKLFWFSDLNNSSEKLNEVNVKII